MLCGEERWGSDSGSLEGVLWKNQVFQGQKGASGCEGLPCPRGHPGFGTSKQLTCFGCSGILCKMTSVKKKKTTKKTQPHGFRISDWTLNICKNSDTPLPHWVGFPGSEGPMWPGEEGEWGFTQSREWPFSQLLRDSTCQQMSSHRGGLCRSCSLRKYYPLERRHRGPPILWLGAGLPSACSPPCGPWEPSSDAQNHSALPAPWGPGS